MNDTPRRERGTTERPDADERELGELLEAAGPRAEVAPEELRALRAAARVEWERVSGGRRSRRTLVRRWLPALAAAGLLVLFALFGRVPRALLPAAESVATIELRRGEVRLDPPPGAEAPSTRVVAGTWIETGSGAGASRLALRLTGGGSLRFDAATRARLASATRIELERGAVYFDSVLAPIALNAPRPVEVATPFGVVREIGTQFEVRVTTGASERLEVGVREGRVALALGADSTPSEHAAAGEWLTLRRDGALARRQVARGAPEWSWILDATPAPKIEGRTLRSLLDWACRETGWELRFDDAELEREAETIRLHGTVDGFRPDQAVEVGLSGAGLGHRFEGRTLVVTSAAPN